MLSNTNQHLHFTEDCIEHLPKLMEETLQDYAKYWPNLAHFSSLHEDQKDLVQKHQIRGSKPATDCLKAEKHIFLPTHLKIYNILGNIKKKKKKRRKAKWAKSKQKKHVLLRLLMLADNSAERTPLTDLWSLQYSMLVVHVNEICSDTF